MVEQKLLLGNVRGPQGAAGPNTVSSSTTTSGFENGQVLFNNNGKVGAKKLTASDVGALDAGGTAVAAKKLFNAGVNVEAYELQCLDKNNSPYGYFLKAQYNESMGCFLSRVNDASGGGKYPLAAGALQCVGVGGAFDPSYAYLVRAQFDRRFGGYFDLFANGYAGIAECSVKAAGEVIASSSIRYKEDIHTVEDELLDSVLGLDVIDFIYNSDAPEHVRDKKRHFGMIAEQVVKVMPDSVTLDREGLPAAVVYSDFIPLLLAQLKRQQKQMGALEQRIRQLEEGNRE